MREHKHGQYYFFDECTEFLSSNSVLLPALQDLAEKNQRIRRASDLYGSEPFVNALDSAIISLEVLQALDSESVLGDEFYSCLGYLKGLVNYAYN
jgi:hypothetical protein